MGNHLSPPVLRERTMTLIGRRLTRTDYINRLVNLTLVNDEIQLRKLAAKALLTKEELNLFHEKVAEVLGEFCTDMPEVEFRDEPTPSETEETVVQSSSSDEASSSSGSPSSEYDSGSPNYSDSGLCNSDINSSNSPMEENLEVFESLLYLADLQGCIFGYRLKKIRDAKKEAELADQLSNSAPPYVCETSPPVVYLYKDEDIPRSATPTRPPGVQASTQKSQETRFVIPTGQPEFGASSSTSVQSTPKFANPTRPLGVDSVLSCAKSECREEISIPPMSYSPIEGHGLASTNRRPHSRILGKIGPGLLTRGKAKRNIKASSHELGVSSTTTPDIMDNESSAVLGNTNIASYDKNEISHVKDTKKKKGLVRRFVDNIRQRMESMSSHVIRVKPATPDCVVLTIKSQSTEPPMSPTKKVISEVKQRPDRRIIWPGDRKGPNKVLKKKVTDANTGANDQAALKVNTDIKTNVRCRRQSNHI